MEQFNISGFLDKKYQDLAGSKPVERAVQKAQKSGETPYSREERIDAYFNRLETLFGQEGDEDEGGFELLKFKILNRYITKPDEISESYWNLQENIMRENGQLGDWNNANEEQKIEIKKQNSEGVLNDQEASLEQWIDYFHTKDSNYIPRELKYWIFRNIIKLQEFDKEKKEFPKRSKGTVKMFPDLNHEALAYVIDQIIKKLENKSIEWGHDIQQEERREFEQYLDKEDFAKLYAWANELMSPIPEHLLPITEGEWRKFDKGTSEDALFQSIRGKGTGWCTAGKTTAHKQLQRGDFYIYYSFDDKGDSTIPRLAIRMEDNNIAEVRGIAYKQNIDPYMTDVLEEKLNEFPDKEIYLKKKRDMEQLTTIDKKSKNEEQLTKSELEFLYELNSTIEGFGYQKDPRIDEIRSKRNIQEDTSVIFGCTKEQIATNVDEVDKNTKVYIGEWNPTTYKVIKKYPNIVHLYESSLDKEIFMFEFKTDSSIQFSEQVKQKIEERGWISDYAKEMLKKVKFSKEQKQYKLVQFTLRQLGFFEAATIVQILSRVEEIGLKFCPAEIGPQFRLTYEKNKEKELGIITPNQIDNTKDFFDSFCLSENFGLSGGPVPKNFKWVPQSKFIFLAD